MSRHDTLHDIRPLDVHDDAALEAAYATYAASDRHGREELASSWDLEEVRVDWRAEKPHRWQGVWVVVDGGATAAVGWVTTPLQDNPQLASVELYTHPDHRGRGHGSALLTHLERVAGERGRSILVSEVPYPYAAPADGAGETGPDFLTRRGWEFGLGDVKRTLALPVAEERLDRLAARAAPHHAAYRLETFTGPVPDAWAEQYAALAATLMTEAPTGELDLEPESPDVAILRSTEETLAQQGRTRYTTLAFHDSGVLAGLTDLVTSAHDAGRAYQWGTMVDRAHRGRRLGLALKVANLRAFQRARADTRTVVTYNAEVNAHMIGVNELLGFVPVERLGEFQKRL